MGDVINKGAPACVASLHRHRYVFCFLTAQMSEILLSFQIGRVAQSVDNAVAPQQEGPWVEPQLGGLSVSACSSCVSIGLLGSRFTASRRSSFKIPAPFLHTALLLIWVR